ncbi:M23 family metallopeptidase [Pseudarthrobacter sp. NPDC092424]|uniref:M23 family metallopeptidase n=1 Tax=Pseudarthrobacter sp. NPDC092424 TaxID=3364415 RepID=UPI0038224440
MGKHLARAAARRKAQQRRSIIRLTVGAGTALVALSALALTANGAVATPQSVPSNATAADGAAVDAPEAVAAVAVAAPSSAALEYTRTSVRTLAKPKPKKLKLAVASATPARPAAETVAPAAPVRPADGTLLAPLEFLNPSSPFGPRTSPITGKPGEFHWGKDFAAPCGTGVHAADEGVVRAAGWAKGGGGNHVAVDHGNGLVTTYNHLASIGVREGQTVKPGELIATVGTTGSSTGCHLHFETIKNGAHTDPAAWELLPERPAALSAR